MELGRNFKLYNTPVKPWEEGRWNWTTFDPQSLGRGSTIKRLNNVSRETAETLADVWAKGFPELYRGTFGFLLEPEWYGNLPMEGHEVFALETSEGHIAGSALLRTDSLNLSVDFTLGVVHPDFRGRLSATTATKILDRYAEESGAELATVSVARFHTVTLKLFHKLGFRSVGILPGAIRANVDGIYYRRDSVELLYKLYRDAYRLVPPLESEEK